MKRNDLESELENINSEMNKLEDFFINPEKFDNPDQLAEFGIKFKDLQKQSKELEQEWEQLSSTVEGDTHENH